VYCHRNFSTVAALVAGGEDGTWKPHDAIFMKFSGWPHVCDGTLNVGLDEREYEILAMYRDQLHKDQKQPFANEACGDILFKCCINGIKAVIGDLHEARILTRKQIEIRTRDKISISCGDTVTLTLEHW